MGDVIVILIIAAAVILAVRSMIKAKKKGKTCMGCSNSAQCGGNCRCKQD